MGALQLSYAVQDMPLLDRVSTTQRRNLQRDGRKEVHI